MNNDVKIKILDAMTSSGYTKKGIARICNIDSSKVFDVFDLKPNLSSGEEELIVKKILDVLSLNMADIEKRSILNRISVEGELDDFLRCLKDIMIKYPSKSLFEILEMIAKDCNKPVQDVTNTDILETSWLYV